MITRAFTIICAGCLLFLAACAGSQVVPSDLKDSVVRNVSIKALETNPEQFTGRPILLGGKVLSAKRLKDGTQLEVLQLPLNRYDAPTTRDMNSQGRFLVLDKSGRDPATFPAGTYITVIGEAAGVKKMPLDDIEYQYPVLQASTLKIWPEHTMVAGWPSSRPYMYGYPYPYPPPVAPLWWDPWY